MFSVREFFREKFRRKPDRYGESLVAAAFEIPGGLDLIALTQLLDEMIDRYKLLFREVHEPGANYRCLGNVPLAGRCLARPLHSPASSFVDGGPPSPEKKLNLKGPPGVGKDFRCSTLSLWHSWVKKHAIELQVVHFHQHIPMRTLFRGTGDWEPDSN